MIIDFFSDIITEKLWRYGGTFDVLPFSAYLPYFIFERGNLNELCDRKMYSLPETVLGEA